MRVCSEVVVIFLYRKIKVCHDKVIVDIGREFNKYYLSLIPKSARPKSTRYDAHITIIRSFEKFNIEPIKQYHNTYVLFSYNPYLMVEEKTLYFEAFCATGCLIRRLAGLSNYREGRNSFHITIGKL